MTMDHYDVAALTKTFTDIWQKFYDLTLHRDTNPSIKKEHIFNLKRELRNTLDFLKTSTTNGTENSTSLAVQPPILEGFKTWSGTLTLEETDPIAIANINCTALWYCRTLQHRERWTKSPGGFLLYLSLLPSQQPQSFEWDSAHQPIAQWRADGASLPRETEVDELSYDLSLLNAELNNHEPEEYYRECLWIEMRNGAIPDYERSASNWINGANRHWTALRPQVFTLFNPSNKYNFVQWALQWARDAQPGLFQGTFDPITNHGSPPTCSNAEATIDFTNDLCDGSLTPLHIAALLGLPHLCKDLVSAGVDANRLWRGRTALHCALEGDAKSLWVYAKTRKPSIDFDPMDAAMPFVYDCSTYNLADRVETIRRLLDHSTEICDEVSLGAILIAPKAFWASYQLDDFGILTRVLSRGATVNELLGNVLIHDALSPQTPEQTTRLSRALTDLHGHCLLDEEMRADLGSRFSTLIEEAMQYHGLSFHTVDGSCPLPGASEERVYGLVFEAIVSGACFDLRRICLGPKFVPNPREGFMNYENQSYLHLAVESDNLEIVDILLESGADLNALDADHRTPLMAIESPRMAAKLVLQYGASTECQDKEGRTVWHSAAYNDDVAVLSWLAQHDPSRDNNMVRKSNEGCTPLAEAMHLIDRLKEVPFSEGPIQQPAAARFLLKHTIAHGGDHCLDSPTPLTHLAAAWGEMEMIEDLVECGADWHQLDNEGRTALECMNFSARPHVIRRLQRLCKGAKASSYPHNIVESVFSNFAPILQGRGDHRKYALSQHPSCQGALMFDAFKLLLRRELVTSTDSTGRHFWDRFCANIFTAPAPKGLPMQWRDKVMTAMACVLETKALADYEKKTGTSGLVCLLSHKTDKAIDADLEESMREMGFYAMAAEVLVNSDSTVLGDFYRSEEARKFFYWAVQMPRQDLVTRFCEAGVKVLTLDSEETAVKSPLMSNFDTHIGPPLEPVLAVLLRHVEAEELTRALPYMLKVMFDLHRGGSWFDEQGTRKIRMMLDKGMDVRGIRHGHTLCHDLDDIARSEVSREFAELLIDHGADIAQHCETCGPPPWAADSQVSAPTVATT